MNALMAGLAVVNYAAAGIVVVAFVAGAAALAWWALAPTEAPEPAPERVYRSIEDCVPSRQSWR